MEQVPHIAMFCQENRPSIPYAFSKYLLPIVVRYLADQNNQVRKTSQAALLVLLEQELIERYDVETKVCPVLVELTAPDSHDDVKTEAVAIMCKMATMVGKDITERLILPRFCEMCCDCRTFHVRKVCAANFGDICSVVGQQATEEMLLPRFFQLCSDNVWGVRKACAECFMAVSCATSQEVRRTKLSTLFINLISDPSRWVRQAAFQSLGPFISTFANPSSSGQFFKEEECKDAEDQNFAEEHSNEKNMDSEDILTHDVQSQTELLPLEDDVSDFEKTLDTKEESNSVLVHYQNETCFQPEMTLHCTLSPEPSGETADETEQSFDDGSVGVLPAPALNSQENSVSEQELYNSFHFWRTPLPEIDIDLELQETAEILDSETQEGKQEVVASAYPNITMAKRKELEEMIENLEPHMDDPDVKAFKSFWSIYNIFTRCSFKAQVEVLSAALRASGLDPLEEATTRIDKLADCQSELRIKDQLNCKLIQDDTVPSLNNAVENIVESALRYIHNDSDLSTNSSFSPEEEKKSKIQAIAGKEDYTGYLWM
ncbi:UNVERIFIED_CONTAM: hypothetical protein K2H54_052749 [Gekko kuhli]